MKRVLFIAALVVAALLCRAPADAQQQNIGGTFPYYGTITTATAGAGNAVVAYPISASTCSGVISGAWTGTLEFDVSGNAGGTVAAVYTETPVRTQISSSQTTTNVSFTANVQSFQYFQVRATATMTGTAVVQFACSNSPF